MYKENGIANRRLRTIIIIKDTLLIDIDFLLKFWIEVIDIVNYLQNHTH